MTSSPDVIDADLGPDLVIAGAARSGTSLLAARLSSHPRIDAPSVKEPNYFSRHRDLGPGWYDAFFPPRRSGQLRLDASVSYTYPQHETALAHLHAAAPGAFVVYVVREPVQRAVSHYLFYRHYFEREPAPTFGAALETSSYYLDVSDYARWLGELQKTFGSSRVLVVPFSAVTASSSDVADVICREVGLAPLDVADEEVERHQNNTVTFRSEWVRLGTRALRHSRAYPRVRSWVGPHRMKRIRAAVTRTPALPTVAECLATCSAVQRDQVGELAVRASTAVEVWLKEQDSRTGLSWAALWSSHYDDDQLAGT